MSNPRYSNGNLRRKHRARLKAMGGPCGICKGRLGPIHYDEPSDSKHPLSFVIDEIKPVSRWKEFGYVSKEAAAQDWNNLQAAHYCCNAVKSNKVVNKSVAIRAVMQNISDGKFHPPAFTEGTGSGFPAFTGKYFFQIPPCRRGNTLCSVS